MGDEPETPKALSQHEPHRSNPEFPHWGRDELDHSHAIFAIAAHLRTLALEHWTPRIVRWLSFYDGIERWVDPGQEPCLCVRDLLASYVLCLRSADRPHNADTATSMDASQLKQRIIDDLLCLDFLRYRAYWSRRMAQDGNALVWVPLQQSWLSFVELARPGDELMVYLTACRITPPLETHRVFLNQE